MEGVLLVAVRRAHILWVAIHQSLNHPALSGCVLSGMHAVAFAQLTSQVLVHSPCGCEKEAAHAEPDRQSHASST